MKPKFPIESKDMKPLSLLDTAKEFELAGGNADAMRRRIYAIQKRIEKVVEQRGIQGRKKSSVSAVTLQKALAARRGAKKSAASASPALRKAWAARRAKLKKATLDPGKKRAAAD